MNENPASYRRWPVLLLLVAVAAIIWLTLPPREPSYQGKRLSYWLSLAVTNSGSFYDQENPTITQCRTAIRAIGTNALPTLLRILKAKDSGIKRAVANLVDRQSLVTLPIHSVEEHKMKALAGFFLLGDLATNAAAALIELCKEPGYSSTRDIAADALMQLYPAKCVEVPYWVPAGERADWYLQAGSVQLRVNAASNALLAFSQAIQLNPTNAEAWVSRGAAAMDVQDFRGALSNFDKALELSSSNETAVLGRGWSRFALKDFPGAEADFSRAITWNTNDARALNLRGLARANQRQFAAALADLDQAVELASYDAEIYRNRAMVEAAQMEFEQALADASKSLELEPKDAVAWALRGRIQSALKNYPGAIADANKAIELNPKDSLAWAGRGAARMCMNDLSRSAADLEQAIELNPQNASAFLARGFLGAKRGQDNEALADFEHALKLAPQVPETHGMLGVFQYKMGQFESALENCRQAIALGPDLKTADFRAYVWLIRAQAGEQQAANSELETYFKSLDASHTNEWRAVIARFFSGHTPETNFLTLAITTARRPSAATTQACESLYYAGMKRKLAGDQPGAIQLFHKCLATSNDNTFAYLNAKSELRSLK